MVEFNDYPQHNLQRQGIEAYMQGDPHLRNLAHLKYQDAANWWQDISPNMPGIYILTGGRQVGKSTSTKLLIKDWLNAGYYLGTQIFYLPCDEIFDAKHLGAIIRAFLNSVEHESFLLIIDEVTYVTNWDRVIKGIADEGYFQRGICILTGSDTLILKEASMRFPGRRGQAEQVDFHLYPLSFSHYVNLISSEENQTNETLAKHFSDYLKSGGYLRAINDLATHGEISTATYLTYEQWIRGDFLKKNRNETYLLSLLKALCTNGVSQISYSKLTQNIGLISKDTCIEYCNLLERMDILFNLQAYDQNKKQGSPRKERKFHFFDPFIQQTIRNWLQREGYFTADLIESHLVEACVASHCHRLGQTFYFKGQGEIDVITKMQEHLYAIEVKWGTQVRAQDLKMLHLFNNAMVLHKSTQGGFIESINSVPVYRFLYELPGMA